MVEAQAKLSGDVPLLDLILDVERLLVDAVVPDEVERRAAPRQVERRQPLDEIGIGDEGSGALRRGSETGIVGRVAAGRETGAVDGRVRQAEKKFSFNWWSSPCRRT